MSIKLTRRRLIQTGGAVAALPLIAAPAIAQTWPTKPIRFVISFPPGGLVDTFARVYGEYISKAIGQTVIIESKPGGGGQVAALEVKGLPPDGYNLLFTISSIMSTNKVLFKDLPYDPDKDFVRISYMSVGSIVFIVNVDTGVKDLKEFVEYARKNTTNIGTPGPGSYSHIMTAELNKQFGLKLEPVHYRGETPMFTDLNGGVLQAVLATWTGTQPSLQSGRARPIAVTGQKRIKKLPEVATFTEQGVTSQAFRLTSYICAVGPVGMPDEIVNRYSDLFVSAGKTDKVQRLLDTLGIDDSAVGREAFQKLYDEESPVWRRLASSLGLSPF